MSEVRALVITDHNYKNKGNIVSGLMLLEKLIRQDGGCMLWLFTSHVKECEWTKQLENCYFLSDNRKDDASLIADIAKKFDINVIHTHFCTQNILADVKLYCLRHKNVKFVRHMHMLYFTKSNILAEKAKQFLSFGDANVACSEMCADSMKKAGVKNVVTVTNGVDFDSLTRKRNSHSGLHILLFGYNYVNKGVKTAICGVKKLDRRDVVLDICVAGDLENIKRQIISDFGEIPSFVSFVKPNDNVSELYSDADIFLSAGSIESYCFAVREALYCGCRVVASKTPSQIMNCGEVLFEAGNADSLAKALEIAAEKPCGTEKDAEMVKNNSVSLKAWAEGMYEVYKGLI